MSSDSSAILVYSSATTSDGATGSSANGSSVTGTDVTRSSRALTSVRASTSSPRSGTSGDFDVDVTFQQSGTRKRRSAHPYSLPPVPSSEVPRVTSSSQEGSWVIEGPSTPSSILNASCSDVGRSGQQNEDSIMCLSNGCESRRALIQSAIEAINYGTMEITKNQLQARDLSDLITDDRVRQ